MKKQFLKFGVAAMLVFGASTVMVSCSSNAEEAAEALEQLEEEMEAKSEKGNWIDEDIEKFRGETDKVRDNLEAMLGDNTDAFVDCYLEKAIANYDGFDSANSDQAGMQQLATECMQDMMPSMEDMMSEEETEATE